MTNLAGIGKIRDMIGSPDYNKKMKKISFHIVSMIIILLFAGCGQKRHDEVLVIEKTKSYHIDECPRVNMADTKFMTIAEAKALNCKACPGCKPDQHQ